MYRIVLERVRDVGATGSAAAVSRHLYERVQCGLGGDDAPSKDQRRIERKEKPAHYSEASLVSSLDTALGRVPVAPFILFILLLLSASVLADPQGDAQQLKDDALSILKANTAKKATPDEYATCILKLEKAVAILEKAKDTDSGLAQECNASLFWARKFSDINVLNALDKLRKEQGGGTAAPQRPMMTTAAPAVKPKQGETAEQVASREASKAYNEAETFAGSHSTDQYAIALRWFQMANLHPGTDSAIKALEHARMAQARFAVTQNVAAPVEEQLADTPEFVLVKEADKQVAAGKYETSFALYKSSLQTKETAIAHRRLANAYFKHAQQMKDELKPKMDQNTQDYTTAFNNSWANNKGIRTFNPDSNHLKKWKYENDELRKQSDQASKYYEFAEGDFRAILKLAPGNKDFESAGYIGLCQGMRQFSKMKGLGTLREFVKDYSPENDSERTLYEFCKTEIDRLRSGR